jgi:hypothetical protein
MYFDCCQQQSLHHSVVVTHCSIRFFYLNYLTANCTTPYHDLHTVSSGRLSELLDSKPYYTILWYTYCIFSSLSELLDSKLVWISTTVSFVTKLALVISDVVMLIHILAWSISVSIHFGAGKREYKFSGCCVGLWCHEVLHSLIPTFWWVWVFTYNSIWCLNPKEHNLNISTVKTWQLI